MSDSSKNTYTPKRAKAIKKYLSEKVEDIRIRVPKGKKEYYKKVAEAAGESLNSFIIKSMEDRIQKENLDKNID